MSLVKQSGLDPRASTLGLVSGNGSISYNEDKDAVFCHVCVSALKQKKLQTSRSDPLSAKVLITGRMAL